MIFDSFWRKHSPPSQNALNPHLFSLFFLQNHWFLRGNGLFCARTVSFWEEMNFFIQEPSVFERKWTFLCQNCWFLRGNRLFCPRIIGFWKEMNFSVQESSVFERKWPFTLKNTLELETKWPFTPKVYLTSSFVFVYLSCFFNFLVKNKNEQTYLLSRASEMNFRNFRNFRNWKH